MTIVDRYDYSVGPLDPVSNPHTTYIVCNFCDLVIKEYEGFIYLGDMLQIISAHKEDHVAKLSS